MRESNGVIEISRKDIETYVAAHIEAQSVSLAARLIIQRSTPVDPDDADLECGTNA